MEPIKQYILDTDFVPIAYYDENGYDLAKEILSSLERDYELYQYFLPRKYEKIVIPPQQLKTISLVKIALGDYFGQDLLDIKNKNNLVIKPDTSVIRQVKKYVLGTDIIDSDLLLYLSLKDNGEADELDDDTLYTIMNKISKGYSINGYDMYRLKVLFWKQIVEGSKDTRNVEEFIRRAQSNDYLGIYHKLLLRSGEKVIESSLRDNKSYLKSFPTESHYLDVLKSLKTEIRDYLEWTMDFCEYSDEVAAYLDYFTDKEYTHTDLLDLTRHTIERIDSSGRLLKLYNMALADGRIEIVADSEVKDKCYISETGEIRMIISDSGNVDTVISLIHELGHMYDLFFQTNHNPQSVLTELTPMYLETKALQSLQDEGYINKKYHIPLFRVNELAYINKSLEAISYLEEYETKGKINHYTFANNLSFYSYFNHNLNRINPQHKYVQNFDQFLKQTLSTIKGMSYIYGAVFSRLALKNNKTTEDILDISESLSTLSPEDTQLILTTQYTPESLLLAQQILEAPKVSTETVNKVYEK